MSNVNEDGNKSLRNSKNLIDIISKNITKRSGTASFKSSIDRTRHNVLIKKPIAPPIGYYDYKLHSKV